MYRGYIYKTGIIKITCTSQINTKFTSINDIDILDNNYIVGGITGLSVQSCVDLEVD